MIEQESQQKVIKEKFQSQLSRLAQKLESEHAPLQATLTNFQKENKTLKESLKNLTLDLLEKFKKLESEPTESLKKNLEHLKINVDEMYAALYVTLSPAFIQEDAQITAKKQSLETLRETNLKLLDEIKDNQAEKTRLAEEISVWEQKIKGAIQIKEKLVYQLTSLQTDVSKNEAELNELREKSDLLKSELDKKEISHKELVSSLSLLDTSFKKQQKEKKNLLGQKDTLTKLIGDLEDKIKKCQAQSKEIETALSAEERDHQKITEELNSLAQALKLKEQETEKLKFQMEQSEREFLAQNRQLKELSAVVDRLNKQIRLKEIESQKIDAIKQEHQDRIEFVASELQRLQPEQQKLIQAIAPLETQYNQLQEERNKAAVLVEQAQTELLCKEEHLKKVEDEIEFLRGQVAYKNKLNRRALRARLGKETELQNRRQKILDLINELQQKQCLLQELRKTPGEFELTSQEKLAEATELLESMNALCAELEQKAELFKKTETEVRLCDQKRNQWAGAVQQSKPLKSKLFNLLKPAFGKLFSKIKSIRPK